MTKTELQKIYNILDSIYSDFHFAYSDYTNGKNVKIKSQAERKIDNAIELASYHIRSNDFICNLLVGENANDTDKAYFWDEFVNPRWFGRDLSRLLRDIQQKIKEASD